MPESTRQQLLSAYDRELATTLRVLRAYPKDKLDIQPHPKLKTARELAFGFALERVLGMKIWRDEFATQTPAGSRPQAPDSLEEIIAALEKSAREFRDLIESASETDLSATVHFFTAPKTLGEMSRLEVAWFLLHDEIHHRGQFSVYLRMADARVPSIYGPTADEPWM